DARAARRPRPRVPGRRVHHPRRAQDARLRGLSHRGRARARRRAAVPGRRRALPVQVPAGVCAAGGAAGAGADAGGKGRVVRRPPVLLLVVTFLAMAKFYAHELVLGQVNLLFGVLAALAIVWMASGRDAAAGALLALAVVVKPYAAMFLPWIAVRRSRAAFAAMIGGLAILLLLPAARYGWQGNLQLLGDWWHTVTATTAPNLANPDNVSLRAMFTKWLGPDSSAPLLAAGLTAILLGLAGIVMAGRGNLKAPDALEGSLLLLMIPLLSPQGWDYVLLIGTPAVMLLVNYLPALPRGLRVMTVTAIAAVAFSIFDLMGRAAYATFMQLSLITVFVLIEIAAIVTLRFRRAA